MLRDTDRGRYIKIIGTGSFLAFISGYLNSIALNKLILRSVGNMTGPLNAISKDLLIGPASSAWEEIGTIFVFCSACCICGALCGETKLKFSPGYGILLLLESLMLFTAFAFLQNQLKLVAEFFICFSCGLNNAIGASYSGLLIRPTHMTGVVTDIGIVLGVEIRSRLFHKKKSSELWRLHFLVPLLVLYSSGTFVGLFVYLNIVNYAFFPPAFVTAIAGVISLIMHFTNGKTINPAYQNSFVCMRTKEEAAVDDSAAASILDVDVTTV